MPTVREFEQAFQEDPSHQPAFLALRKAYREKQRFDKLVTLYESRAQALAEDDEAAELYFLAAELRLDQLADPAGGETVLQYALERKRGHVKAAERLKLLYRDQGRTSEYLTMLEMAAAAIVENPDANRRASLDAEMAQLFSRHIERLETALQGPQRAQEFTPEALKTVVSARKIHKALGDWSRVLRLYDLEAGATADPKRRADLLLACAKLLVEKATELQTALDRVNEALRLRPNDERMLELQATIFAHPQWTAPDGRDRAAGLLHQLARRRHEAGDLEGAISLARRGLSARAGHEDCSGFLEKILRQAGRLKDLDRYYRERTADAADNDQKVTWLYKRAKLAQDELKDEAEALRCYEELVSLEAPGGAVVQHLATLYGGRKNYAKLAELRERQLAVVSDSAARLPLLRELASLYRDRLGDADQGAVYLHAILQLEPQDELALKDYGDHFRRRGDLNALADLLEFAADSAQTSGTDVAKVAAWLEEVAGVAERNLNDTGRALTAWAKLEALGVNVEQARETQKRLLLKDKRWDGLAEVLLREAAVASDDAKRIEVWRRLAKVYLDRLGASEKAVETYRCILGADPADASALRAVVDILEAAQRWADLADVIAGHCQHAPPPERVAWLRKLGVLYSDQLERPADAAKVARSVLELVPGDKESFVRLEGLLEATGDLPGLAQVLIEHAATLAPGDQAQLLSRAARLHQSDLEQPDQAAPLWERVLALDPGDPGALNALTTLYEELGKPAELARVLQLQVERAADEPVAQVAALRRMAHLATGPLADSDRAVAAWEALLVHVPDDAEALEQVCELYRASGSYRKLADALGVRVASLLEPQAGVKLALERALVLEQQLQRPTEAIEVLDQIVDGLDPRNNEALARLRRLAEAHDDWQKVANVAERQMLLQDDLQARVATAMQIAEIQRDRLGDPERAMAAFERVLGMTPEHRPALEALAGLYAMAGEAERLVAVNEKLLALTEGEMERRRLMFNIADAWEGGLSNPRKAFAWVARAHAELADDDTWERLESLSETHALWDELIRVHEAARARAATPEDQVVIAEGIAHIYEDRVGDPARAFAVLQDALSAQPAGDTLLPQLERLAEVVRDWQALLDVYTRVARGRPSLAARAELLQRRAQIHELRLENPSAAMDEWLRRFGQDHTDDVARDEILRLAGRTGRWEDALKIYGQLFARAADADQKVSLAKQAAALVEDRVKDRVRAFRAYLNAFRLAPQDSEIVGHLWRLAALIGRFDDEPQPQVHDVPELVVQAVGRSSSDPDSTLHLAIDSASVGASADDVIVDDVTDTLSLDDAEEVEGPAALNGAPPLPAPKAPPLRRNPLPLSKQAFESAWAEFANAYALLPALDNSTRRSHLLKIAAIWEKGANETDKAFDALEKAFALDPFDPQVRAELERLAEERSDWDRLSETFLEAIDSSMSTEDAVSIHHDVAGFYERLGLREKAEERYLAVVNLRSHDRKALDQLEDIYRSGQRWAALAGLLERRRSESDLGPSAQRAKAIELASLYQHKLDRPYEAIDTLEGYLAAFDDEPAGPDESARLAELRQVLDDITVLYGQVDLWVKAANATQRSLDLESQPPARKLLALKLARIYEKELALPAKAADAYAALLEDHPDEPDALAALDRLYESLGRFEDLADLLARRIATCAPEDMLNLVKRRARILEDRLGNPDAAASSLRGLGAQMLGDDDIAGALLRNLRRAGLGHEAARLVSQRIEHMAATKAEPERVVALQLELARVRLDDMNDVEGALEALQAARQLQPNNSETLSMLARLHLKQGDFAAFAEARAQEALALGDGPEAAQAMIDAGRVQRDQLRNLSEAKKLFAGALKLTPDNAEAVRALASLLLEQGEPEKAEETLRAFLEQVQDPMARAEALTDLARIVLECGGRVAEAAAFLEEAVELEPDLQAAIVALANLHCQEQQWDQAERRLMQALRRLKNNPESAEPLLSRLAEVYEKLGRPEDGYRQLQEADKKDPGRLRVKIALGKNRFQVRKWRETLSHLENVDAHPDAAAHAHDVGAALAMAGESCLKLKQAEKARDLFARSLKHAPAHPRALLSLAALELGAKNLDAAGNHLRALPNDEGEPGEKVALFEQLGDLYQQQGSVAKARSAFEQAVSMVAAPTAAHLPLFDKTLELQRAAGAVADAAETSARLIGLEADAKQRAKRRREAAATLVKHGQLSRAGELLAECLDDDMSDEVALAALIDVHEQLGTSEACVFRLERILPTLPPPAAKPQARALRVKLWHRLGQLRLASSNEAARRALEQALAIDPKHASSREVLAGLYVGESDAAAALANHRALALANPTRVESLRAIASAYAAEGKLDGAHCVYEVMRLLGLDSSEDRFFLEANPPRSLKPDEPYQGLLRDDARRRHLLHPEAATMADVFCTIWEGGLELDGPTLEELGVSAADKISPLSEQDVAKIFAEVSKALDNQKPGLYIAWDPKVLQMEIALSRPPAIVMPASLATLDDTAQIRFWIGRTLELTRPEHILGATIKPRAFSHLFGSVLKAFHPRHARRRGNDIAADAAAKLKKALPYRVAKRLGELFAQMGDEPFSSARWRELVEETGNRAGLVACGDLACAARAVLGRSLGKPASEVSVEELRQHAGKEGALLQLLRFALSDSHMSLRAELGLAVPAAAAA